jgi:hypothetical protein
MLSNILLKIPEGVWILAGLGLAWVVVTIPIWRMVKKKEPSPNFEYHWGSLGRGLGGWNVSWSLVLALAWLMLTFGSVAVAVELLMPPSVQSPTGGEDGGKPAGDGAKPDTSKPAGDGSKPDASKPAPSGTAATDSKKGGE